MISTTTTILTSISPETDDSKKKSKSIQLPWWCVIVSWIILVICTLGSTALVIFYGITFGVIKIFSNNFYSLEDAVPVVVVDNIVEVILSVFRLHLIFYCLHSDEDICFTTIKL